MNNIEELQEAIRQLSSVGREIIADWLRDFMMEEDHRVAEPAAAYGARVKRDLMTIEEYLKFEEGTPIRHEYVAGEIFAMSGGSLVETHRGHRQPSVWVIPAQCRKDHLIVTANAVLAAETLVALACSSATEKWLTSDVIEMGTLDVPPIRVFRTFIFNELHWRQAFLA